ncbi:CDP-alcohol phosphatidyltransferase family protein [Anaeromyxobacter terrae]|uniref:CDP-alcohol phosphatidyltransferase family protein n=1 Tax=Anaeromyxobacter terrae TaxID=2925406 RepID=UPI001F590628|nr:CDP-alcohol phosphatidyltransferase family protein [Anaeromyxobacter sp. SG22]
MSSVHDLKARFQALLRPVMHALARAGVTPNAITTAALLGSVALGGALAASEARWILAALPAWLLVRMALNALDGMMARELGQASQLGAVLNEVGDVVSDLALYLPFALRAPEAALPVFLFAAAAVLTEFCGVLGQALGGTRRYDGPMGKSDRALVVGAFALVLALHAPAAAAADWFFDALTALALVTCWNRLSRTLTELREEAA